MKRYLGAYTCCLASLAFSQPVFKGGIELVRVPCGVVDSNGAPVGGLVGERLCGPGGWVGSGH